jgi:hypothetical protein
MPRFAAGGKAKRNGQGTGHICPLFWTTAPWQFALSSLLRRSIKAQFFCH